MLRNRNPYQAGATHSTCERFKTLSKAGSPEARQNPQEIVSNSNPITMKLDALQGYYMDSINRHNVAFSLGALRSGPKFEISPTDRARLCQKESDENNPELELFKLFQMTSLTMWQAGS
jgi:hypothetical protein